MDLDSHNAEVQEVWDAYHARKPVRVPMILGVNPRYTMFGHEANPDGVTFKQYFEDPAVMMHRQLEHAEWCAYHLPQDAQMGIPERWTVYPDFQNVYEAAAWGCPIQYFPNQVPDTRPAFGGDEGKRAFLKAPAPDPFESPFFKRVWRMHDFMKQCEIGGYTYRDRPVRAGGPSGLGTDGPFTMLCNLRGASEACLDMIGDPAFAQEALAKATEFIIEHVQAFRNAVGEPVRSKGYGFADDSIALISIDMYEERVMPHHRKLIESVSEPGTRSIHLCGDATRHFPTLHRELNITSFDTGFPVDFSWLRESLGPEVEILGGPSTPFLQRATPAEVSLKVHEILKSGIMEGGRFILREGNNLAPEIPIENVQAMYDCVREHGKYEVSS